MQITETRIEVTIDVTGAPILKSKGWAPIFPALVTITMHSRSGSDYVGVEITGPKVKADGTASKVTSTPYVARADQGDLPWLVEAIEMARAYAAGRGA
jgi:hypothetical protein